MRSTPTAANVVEPMLGSIGKQKFTKALILSGGASVVEVDVGHAPRQGRSRYSPLRLTRLALHVLAGFWPQPIQWIGVALGLVCSSLALALGAYGIGGGSTAATSRARSSAASPFSSSSGSRASSSRSSGSTWAESSGTSRVDPSTRSQRSCSCPRSACSSPAVRGSSRRTSSATCSRATPYEVVSLDALTYAGNVENLADVMSHERLSFVHGDIRDVELVRGVVANVRRDRQRRRGVARREVDQRRRAPSS